MTSIFGFITRVYKVFSPPQAPWVTAAPLRFGILSTANINVQALILPAKSHADVVIAAIAGRNEAKVTKFAKKHGIQKVYSGSESYNELVNDPDLDVIYIPLPHMFHYEWSLKALNAGKHVLVEKPMTNTPEEAARLHDVAREKGLVIMEAMHTRFHPAIQRVKAIVDSGELGEVTHIDAMGLLPKGAVTHTYTEKDFKEGRGVLTGVGCYPIDVIRYFTSPTSMTVSSATYTTVPNLPQIDFSVEASLNIVTAPTFPSSNSNPTATFRTSVAAPNVYGILPNLDMSFTIQCTNGSVYLSNFMIPAIFHKIVVKHTEGNAQGAKVKNQRVEKVYVFDTGSEGRTNGGGGDESTMHARGESWWTTYRYQLEAFVERVREREPRTWYEKSDSVQNLEWVADVYRKMGLEPRPPSDYFVSESHGK